MRTATERRITASDRYNDIVHNFRSEDRLPNDQEKTEMTKLSNEMKSAGKEIAVGAESRISAIEEALGEMRIGDVPDYNQEAKAMKDNKLYAQRSNGEKTRIYRNTEKMEIPEPNEDLSIGRLVRGLHTGNWKGSDAERRSLGSASGSAGGLLVPEAISSRVIEQARAATRVIQAGALTYPMESAKEVFARIITNPTPYWTPENEEITESNLVFQPVTLTAYKLGALVYLSEALLEDASNIDKIINDALSGAMSRAIDYAALSGSGVGQPLGILNCSDIDNTVVSSPSANEVMGHMIDACYELIDQNLDPSEISCLMNSTFGKTLSKAVDGVGAYFGNGNSPDVYSALKRYVTNQINDTDGVSPVAFLRASDLMIGIRRDLTISVSKEAGEAFKKDQVAIKITWRGDSQIMVPDHAHIVNFS